MKPQPAAPVPVPRAKIIAIEMLNPRTWLTGKHATLYLVARYKEGGAPAGNARVTARVAGAAEPTEVVTSTAVDGHAHLEFEMPRLASEDAALVIEAVERGFRLPETLTEWAQFDYVAGEPGPWVSPEKFELIERFKFFHELAWKKASPGKALLQRIARYRCDRDNYRWPVEMLLTRWLAPAQRLS